ncbi:hypothetical protein CLV48_11856 [Cecembia rubra]|uniref:Uncharacterized protein n=1 Tax=Cecembia rubra TaxID=1485585 RepID=A0A2P8DNJ2_9BACT|nr:hypothetical protein CLV48_11856 [Cecembia rubra]
METDCWAELLSGLIGAIYSYSSLKVALRLEYIRSEIWNN